jgi:uncharacterized phiE125 gp8 family phage protein
MSWKVTTQPTIEPVSLAEAKLHLKIETADTADDTLISALIKAAREYCEGFQNRAYIEQSITLKFDDFADEIIVPKPPLISVTSIKYIDVNGTQQMLAATVYAVDTTSEPGRITLAYNQSWPSIRGDANGVEIIYKAGYGATAAGVPESVKVAIKLLIGHWYEHRESVNIGNITTEIPMGAMNLLSIDRTF